MTRFAIFVVVILCLAVSPSHAIFFKALKYIRGDHGRGLSASSVDSDDATSDTLNSGASSYTGGDSRSFGFSTGPESKSDGDIDLDQIFISGPQYIQTSCFEGETADDCEGSSAPVVANSDAAETEDSKSQSYYGYYESTVFDLNSCKDGNRNKGIGGFFTSVGNAQTYEAGESGPDYVRSTMTALQISCASHGAGLGASNIQICANFQDDSILDVDSIDYCDLKKVNDVVENLLCSKSNKQLQTNQRGKNLWGKTHIGNWDFCEMTAFSTGGQTLDHGTSMLKKKMFTPESYDQLDQQCYSIIGEERQEFDSVTCVRANNKRTNTDPQNLLSSNYVKDPLQAHIADGNLLDYLIEESDDATCADDATSEECGDKCDANDGLHGCGYKQIAESRYPRQEYCLSAKDQSMFKELFGCADDQREICGAYYEHTYTAPAAEGEDAEEPEKKLCLTNAVGECPPLQTVYNDNTCAVAATHADRHSDSLFKLIEVEISDESTEPPTTETVEQCVHVPRQCAGGIDTDVIVSHADYLPDTWGNDKSKTYGSSNDNNYVCAEFEIVVANELSAHLDRVDHDITRACAGAIEVFDKANIAYVKFIDPSEIRYDDAATTETDETYSNLYSVLREAWRQAEFTLRSIKIQEQIRDRMLKYRDWTNYRFDVVHATPTTSFIGEPKSYVDGTTWDDTTLGNLQSGGATVDFISFFQTWNEYIDVYEDLSKDEIELLRADLDEVLTEVANAKEFAQELANTQQAAATAVATVSIHFRKKLNFWLKLEEMIEEAFKSALDTNEALQDQKERSFLNSNYANTAVHDPKTYEYTVGNRAKITNGAQYNDNAGRTASGEAEAEPGHEFTSQYSGDGNNNDAERKHEFVSSNLAIETTIVCAAANCGASKQSFYPADFSTFDADEDNCECNSLVYQNEDYPALNRQAQCKVEQGNDEGVCVIGESQHLTTDAQKGTTTVNIEPTNTDYTPKNANNQLLPIADTVDPTGGVSTHNNGQPDDEQLNHKAANIKVKHVNSAAGVEDNHKVNRDRST